MTIQVTVKNDDTRDGAVIKVVTMTADFEDAPGSTVYLNAGESYVFNVYHLQSLMIVEHKQP